MRDNESETFVQTVLTSDGFQVERVKRSRSKTADLYVQDESNSYIIEITCKESDSTWLELVSAAERDGFASDSQKLSYSNTLDSVLRRKLRQIQETRKDDSDFAIVWFHGKSGFAEKLCGVLARTLYGVTVLIDLGNSGFGARECYFYDPYAFHRYSTLDGVVAGGVQGLQLFVNSQSTRAAAFRNSPLYHVFSRSNAAIDPFVMEQSGRIATVDREVDRGSESERLEHLSTKYGIEAYSMGSWNRVQMLASVKLGPEERA